MPVSGWRALLVTLVWALALWGCYSWHRRRHR